MLVTRKIAIIVAYIACTECSPRLMGGHKLDSDDYRITDACYGNKANEIRASLRAEYDAEYDENSTK